MKRSETEALSLFAGGAILLLLFCHGCAAQRIAGRQAPAIDISQIPSEELLFSVDNKLLTERRVPVCHVAVGPIVVSREALAALEVKPNGPPVPFTIRTPRSEAAKAKEYPVFFVADVNARIQEAVAKILAENNVFVSIVPDEEAGIESFTGAGAQLDLFYDKGFRYYIDGITSFDVRVNGVRVNLFLVDTDTSQLLGAVSRTGGNLREASADAAEGILWWIKNDIRLSASSETTRPPRNRNTDDGNLQSTAF
jgi:hypothetical protein